MADNWVVESYEIDTDLGYQTTRHRRFLKPLAAEHDPKEIKKSNKLVTQPIELGKIDIPTNLEALSDDTAAESDTDITEEVGKSRAGPRRSGRIKRDREMIWDTSVRVKKVRTTQLQDSNMHEMVNVGTENSTSI